MKTGPILVVLSALIGSMVVGLLVPNGVVSAAVPVLYDPAKKLYWSHSGLDVLGQPEVLSSAEVQVTDSTGKVVAGSSAPADGTLGFSASPFMVGLPEGTYSLRVRVFDVAGNVSDWSLPLDVRIDKTKPVPPGQIKQQ